MNLFWSTRSLTNNREDHLTEFFAAALELSPMFRNNYASFVLDKFAKKNGWEKPNIVSVETQSVFKTASCRPDMLLKLADGKTILCEHKLDALETEGKETGKKDQLERYLKLPVDGLVYVRSSWKPPNKQVTENPKYIRPQYREHFLWRDFYPILDCEHIFISWIKEAFERLGFTPPHPSIGDFSGESGTENRKNFAKLWASTRSFAHNHGWSVGTGSIIELYMWGNAFSLASNIFISPAKTERFLIRLTPRKGKLATLSQKMQALSQSHFIAVEISENTIRRNEGKRTVVDITTSLFSILGKEEQTAVDIEKKLFTYVTPFLKALQD